MKKLIFMLVIVSSFIAGSINTGIFANAAPNGNDNVIQILQGEVNKLQGRPTGVIAFPSYVGITKVHTTTNIMMPQNGIIGHLVARSSGTPPFDGVYKITIMKNGVDTSLVCTIGSTNTTCDNQTDAFNVNVLDRIYARIDAPALNDATTVNEGVDISVGYTAR